MMKKLAITMAAALIVTTGAGVLWSQAPVTEKLASGNYVVYAPSPQTWRVRVDPKTMSNATVAGTFVVTEGTPKTLDVLVFNEENYTKWKGDDRAERASAKPSASVVRKTEGTINATLTDPGYHYLVISNRHEYEGKKTVVADIKFQYTKQ